MLTGVPNKLFRRRKDWDGTRPQVQFRRKFDRSEAPATTLQGGFFRYECTVNTRDPGLTPTRRRN
jgi:hypothetical protein